MSKTVTNVVIYARYSSHSQNETSIEGQLKVCYDYCKEKNYRVIHEYIDRALTGKTDNRPEFQQMIDDASKKQFTYIIVYQLDRFSRNRYDSAIYKNKLKKHGVRVLSAKENISEDASGILMESVLEGMAEYYSVELRQKVQRGLRLKAEKCLYTGGLITYGYKANPDKTYAIEPQAASIVQRIFEAYANGSTIQSIKDDLKSKGVKNYRGEYFSFNTISKILHNKKYIGYYQYMDVETPDGIPRIVSDELFDRVQQRLNINKKAPAQGRDVKYILSGKLYCGYCHSEMIGYCGTGRHGERHYYYVCKNRRKHTCTKENVRKQYLDDIVMDKCRELLSKDIIDKIAKGLMKKSDEEYHHSKLYMLEQHLADIERKMQNLTKTIIDCDIDIVRIKLCEEMPKLEEERQAVENEISEYTHLKHSITDKQIKQFMLKLQNGSYDTDSTRINLIRAFVNQIYLYEDKMIIIFNTGEKSEVVTPEMIEYIEKHPEAGSSNNSIVERTAIKTNPIIMLNCFAIVYSL